MEDLCAVLQQGAPAREVAVSDARNLRVGRFAGMLSDLNKHTDYKAIHPELEYCVTACASCR